MRRTLEEEGIEGLKEKTRRKPNTRNRVAPEVEEAVLAYALEEPTHGQVRVSDELRKKDVWVSPGGVRCIWLRHGLENRKKRLEWLEQKVREENWVLTAEQIEALEKLREPDRTESEIETAHPGYLLSQDTFSVGIMKGVGRIYMQSVIDTYSRVGFAKLYTSKLLVTSADVLNDRVLPFFEHHDVPVLRVLTDRGTEYCGRIDQHPYQLFVALTDIEHTKTKVRSPQTNGICERFHQTILNDFLRVAFRRKLCTDGASLQQDLDAYIEGECCDDDSPCTNPPGEICFCPDPGIVCSDPPPSRSCVCASTSLIDAVALLPGELTVVVDPGGVHTELDDPDRVDNVAEVTIPTSITDEWDRRQLSAHRPRVQLRPNPTRGFVTIEYQGPADEPVVAEVVEVSGRVVQLMAGRDGVRGTSSFEWDGRTAAGARVPSGIYFVRVSAGSYVSVTRLVVLR